MPVHARDADAVVAHRPDRAGNVRAVEMVVHRVVVVADEVVANEVIDQAVVIVVAAVFPAAAAAILAAASFCIGASRSDPSIRPSPLTSVIL